MLSKMLRGSVNNTTIPPAPTDANFKQVSLLLHGDGTNGAQNNTFLDSSTNNFTITRNGNTTQGTNTPFSQAAGYWSNYNPTASYLTVATNAAFTYGLSDFTMECWVYLTTTGAIQYVIDQRNSGTANAIIPAIYVSASNVLTYFVSNAAQITGTTALTVGTWYHVAVSRSTLSTKMFLNGVQEGSTYTDANSYAASRVVIGSNAATAGNYLVGYVSNVRLVNGTGVYTTTFTPATTPLTAITNTSLLTCQSNYFKDNSSNNFTLTVTGTPSVQPFSPYAPTAAYSTSVNGGSMYCDGTGDYLTFTQQSFATDFTAECWFYRTANTGNTRHNLFSTYSTSGYSGTTNCQLAVQTDGSILVALNGAVVSGFSAVGGNCVPIGAWSHVVYVRSGTNFSVFVNGTRIANGTTSDTLYVSCIGAYIYSGVPDSTYVNGYVSSARLTNTAVYSPSATTITVPTAPLTAITNTSLLLSGTNAGIYDNAIKNDLETVGDAQVSTSVTKFGTGSMKFDGTGDCLTSSNSLLNFGSANFTIEFWINPSAAGSYSGIITERPNTGSYPPIVISINSNKITFSGSTSGSWNINGSFTTGTINVPNGTWAHVAVVRNGTTITSYINGVADLVVTGVTASLISPAYPLVVGAGGADAGQPYNGYLDDVRITTGIARYTATFTPPTSAFPNQ